MTGEVAFYSKMVIYFVIVLTAFTLLAAIYPEAAAAGDELNESGVPLGALFVSGGVIFILMAAGFLTILVTTK